MPYDTPVRYKRSCSGRGTQNSTYVKIAKQIRGTYFIIMNYFNTFPEFDKWKEALILTFNCMDGLKQIERENPSDDKYFRALLKGIKEMAIEVNTACFVTHDSVTKENQHILYDPPLPSPSSCDFRHCPRQISSVIKPRRQGKHSCFYLQKLEPTKRQKWILVIQLKPQ